MQILSHRSAGALPLAVVLLFLAPGCASTAKPRLNYEGYAVISQRNSTIVDAVVTVRNTGSTTATIPAAVCPYQVAAFADAERKSQPLWQSRPEGCITLLMLLPPILIAPGDFFDYRIRATLAATTL